MARAATAPELALFRTEKQWSKLRAAVFQPSAVYTARINQTFSTLDSVLEITYDGGSGTLANVLADMTLLIGSTAGAWDIGIVRIRSVDGSKFYIGETSHVRFADNQYLTAVDDFGLWARQVKLSAGVAYMDGGIAFSDQHVNFDPVPIMGSNRVLKLTGASVSTQFNGASSYCLDSSISSYAWVCATASVTSGMTTSTPTITFNTVGWHLVYLTLTAANGKTFFGVRYVYVWNEANQPPSAVIGDCRTDVESGGWSFDITLFDNADVTTIRDHALVIIFAEDHYGSAEQSIGPLTGCENIVVTGWIAKETINWSPEQGQVRFNAYGAHYWFEQIPAWPDGVELVARTPAAWTEIQGLTINKGVFHFLRWRTTAPRVMDCFLTDNTFYTKEVSSLAQNLWEQLREMTWNQIYARPGVNALNQLYVEVHPQLVPVGSRTWPTVMDIQKGDWSDQIEFQRVTMTPLSRLDFSGVSVNSSGVGSFFFSISPGSAHPRFGKPEIQDNVLLSSQAQANAQCGLYYGYRNNELPDLPIAFQANNRLIDCFPRQKCTITISPSDTVRGNSYAGGLIPTSVAYVQDPKNGRLRTEASFEAETFEALSITYIPPGSSDISIPPSPPFPKFPDFPILLPGVPEPGATISPAVILHHATYGLLYTTNFDAAAPQWIQVNGGLTTLQYQRINQIVITPTGGIYVAFRANSGSGDAPFIAYASSIGGTFTVFETVATILAKFSGVTIAFVNSIAVNPLNGQVAYVIGGNATGQCKIYIGTGVTFAAGAVVTDHNFTSTAQLGSLSYGFGKWMLTGWNTNPASINAYWIFNAAASAITASSAWSGNGTNKGYHVRAGTTDIAYHMTLADGNLERTTGNFGASAGVGDGLTNFGVVFPDNILAVDPTGVYLMGRWNTAKGKSSDSGSSWAALSSLPAGNWWFAYAGSASRWIAAGGSSVRSTENFGTTWTNREGNITADFPLGGIDIVKVVSFA